MPINLGTPEDLGLPTSLAAEMGPNVPAPSSQITQRNRRDALDNADTALVLRQDTLAPITHDLEGLSYATIQLRRQRRVVGGTIERQSPYWIPSQALERQDPLIPSIRTDGPSRARIPLYGAEMERSMAKLLRGTLKVRPNRPPASNDDEEELAEDSLATPEARQATLRRLAMQVLPVSAQWTEESERDYIAGEYGWIYAPERDSRLPASSFLQALHYYAAQLYQAHSLLSPALPEACPSDQSPEACIALRDAVYVPDVSMTADSELFAYWARHSMGWSRSMALHFDASALVALGTLVQRHIAAVPSSPITSTRPPQKRSLYAAWAKERRRPPKRRRREADVDAYCAQFKEAASGEARPAPPTASVSWVNRHWYL
ncbi:hypothetical protein ACI68E_002905 [Malassezia pachydermatis]